MTSKEIAEKLSNNRKEFKYLPEDLIDDVYKHCPREIAKSVFYEEIEKEIAQKYEVIEEELNEDNMERSGAVGLYKFCKLKDNG